MDFGFSFGNFGGPQAEQHEDPVDEPSKGATSRSHRRTTACTELSTRYEYRRAFSEVKLLEAMKYVKPKKGTSYNFITAGDVDSLSYLKVVLNWYDLDYLLCSTWCMAAEDILQLQLWYEGGQIKHLDMYLGEIFPGSYKIEWEMVKKILPGTPWRWTRCCIQEPQQDLRWCQLCRWLLFRHTDKRKYKYKPTNRERQHHHRQGPVRVLQVIF